jgi:phosphoglycolate phosphatase-like HAD superfamily hydrolase
MKGRATKLIFWDIDGTLLYCGAAGSRALRRTFLELYGLEDAFEGLTVGWSMDGTVLARVFERFGIPPSDLAKIEKNYAENLRTTLADEPRRCVLPGVRALLADARCTHSLLTSNLRIGADIKLASVGLLLDGAGCPFFVGGGFGDMQGEKWDAAEHARQEIEALTGAGIAPDEVTLIGDAVYDVETARRCGYRIICVGTGFTPGERLQAEAPDAYFADLSDTEAVCAFLFGE